MEHGGFFFPFVKKVGRDDRFFCSDHSRIRAWNVTILLLGPAEKMKMFWAPCILGAAHLDYGDSMADSDWLPLILTW